MNTQSISELTQQINSRIAGGSPFTTPRAAYHGFERVATIGEVHISIALIEKSVIALRATTRNLLVGSLPVANRLGRGKYEMLPGADVEKWLGEVTGQGEAPIDSESKCNLLDLALTTFSQKNQWHTGESVTIWQNNGHQAWLKNESGFITLTLFKDAKKLTERKYSKKLTVGYFHPGDYAWLESEHLREDYPRWSEQARREVA